MARPKRPLPPKRATRRPDPAASAPTPARLSLHLANRQRTRPLWLRPLRPILLGVLREMRVTTCDLGFTFLEAAEMAQVNQTFLQHSGPTDVITFDYREEPPAASAEPTAILRGEILVCVEVALAQAAQFRTAWTSELVRYLIHGLLHLQGFDDLQAGPRRRMKQQEARLLAWAGARFELAAITPHP